MLDALKAIDRKSVFGHAARKSRAGVRLWPGVVIATFVLCLVSVSAHAQEQFYNFRSMLSAGGANWCIDVPASQYQPGTRLAISNCTGAPNQTFQYESGINLVAGGLCLDGLAQTPNQPPSPATRPALPNALAATARFGRCTRSRTTNGVFSIVNTDGLCVTVARDAIGPGVPLILAECEEAPTQGWVSNQVGRVVYGAYTEPTYYWRGGRRHCWYDNGWNGPGWYWCGENLNAGIGWGGPMFWNNWWFPGQGFVPARRPEHPEPVLGQLSGR